MSAFRRGREPSGVARRLCLLEQSRGRGLEPLGLIGWEVGVDGPRRRDAGAVTSLVASQGLAFVEEDRPRPTAPLLVQAGPGLLRRLHLCTPAEAAPLGERLAHLTLLILGLVATLHQLGYQVTSLLAGLGIGGLGVALAAQKTVEHLFGGVTLSTDQPMRVGDFVKVDTILGTVEHIGLRSTRIRTLDRTIITIPNGKLADMNIETFAARDRIRLSLILGLVYGTTAEQVRAVVEGVEAMLRGHERVWDGEIVVRLMALGLSALEIEIMCWFRTEDNGEFRDIRQDLLLRILEIVEQAGTQVAVQARPLRPEVEVVKK